MSIFLKMFNYSFKRESSRGFWEGRRGEDSREDRGEERVRKEDEEGEEKRSGAEVPKVIIFMRHGGVHSPPAACVIMCLGLQPL